MLNRTLSLVFLLTLLALPVFAADPGEDLREAARQGDLAAIRQLLEQGVPVDAANQYGATALSYAASKGHLEIVKLLLEKGANPNVTDTFYQTSILGWATFNGQAETTAYLLTHGATGVEEALATAVFRKNVEVARAVLATGKATPEALSATLALAEGSENPEMVALLKEAGAKPPAATGFSLPPEALARFAGSYTMPERAGVEATIKAGEGGQIMASFGDQPIPLSPTDATTFEMAGGFLTLRFEVQGETVSGFQAHQKGVDKPMVFVRKPAAPAAEQTAAAAPAPPPPAAPTSPETAPVGVATRDWPAFRGPNAAGTAQGHPPLSWDATSGVNVKFKTAIPGRAHASPIIWGERVFLATAVASDPEGTFRHGLYGDVDAAGNKNRTYSWKLYALDKNTGKILWERTVWEGKPRSDNHIKATQANATPATDGKHLVAMLGAEGLYCYDLDGNQLWRKDLGALDVGWFYDPSYQWGHSSSPIIFEDRVIVQVDRHGDPFLAAYALKDGRELWRTPRENLPSWGTPTLVPAGEGFELVTNGSNKVRAYDPKTGAELWSLGPNSEVTVGTPVVGHGLVFVTGGYPPVRPIYAVRPGGRGDLTLAEGSTSNANVVWSTDKDGTYMPTPLVYGDYLYTTANNGVLTCYRATTGERMYRERIAGKGSAAFTASPVAADGKLYFASEDGEVYVIKAGPVFERLATNPMGEILMATPAISGDVLYVRTLDHLVAVAEPPKS